MDNIDKEFLAYLGNMGKSFGLSDLALKVFGILFMEPKEISMEAIAKKTGYSLASISNTMKMLESMGQVQRVRKPGTKKVFFRMDKDMIGWNIRKLDFAQQSIIQPAKNKLPEIIDKYKEKAKTEYEKEKVKIVQDYYTQVTCFEQLLKKWKKDLEGIKRG